MKKIPKIVWMISGCFMSGLAGCLTGRILYALASKPDGYLYLDRDTKNIYAQLNQDPDKYRNGSKLIFKYKK